MMGKTIIGHFRTTATFFPSRTELYNAKKLPTVTDQPRSHLCTVPKAATNCWTSSLVAEAGKFLTCSRLLFLQQL